jgi:glycogen(starch) synthase
MRVLMFSWEYPPYVVGGLGQHVAELVPSLGDLFEVELHLVTPGWAGGPPSEHVGQVMVHRVDPPQADGDVYTRAWRTNLRLEEYALRLWHEGGPFDLIHVHDWLVSFAGVALKHSFKVPLVTTMHATEQGRGGGHLHSDLSRAIHHAEWWLTYESWRVIACSAYMAREVTSYFRCPWEKIDVIPNGVEATRYDRLDGANLAHFRSMYGLPSEQIVFSVGRLVYEKGLQVLLYAAPQLVRQVLTVKVVIAGRGPELDWLRSLAWSLGIGEKVLFTGYISDGDRDRLFKIADCAVFPSLYEPFGIVALEAMAARCPVVVSDVGGLSDVVQHGETGVTVYPDDANSLAWGILETLTHPQETAERVKKAHRLVHEEYSWAHIARRTADVYQRVLDERAATEW